MKTTNFVFEKNLLVIILLLSGLFFQSCEKTKIIEAAKDDITNVEGKSSTSNNSNSGINLEKYKKLKEGMTYAQVKNILGSDGVQDESDKIDFMGNTINSVIYTWQDSESASITVMFQNDKMTMKSQFGLDIENSVANKETNITIEKFDRVKEGMTYEEVVQILGGPGDEASSNEITIMGNKVKSVLYGWKGSDLSSIAAMFQNNKLVSKSQIGLD